MLLQTPPLVVGPVLPHRNSAHRLICKTIP